MHFLCSCIYFLLTVPIPYDLFYSLFSNHNGNSFTPTPIYRWFQGYGRAIDLDSSVITMEGDISEDIITVKSILPFAVIQKGFEGVDGLSSSALSDPRLLWPTAQVFYIMDNKFGIHELVFLYRGRH